MLPLPTCSSMNLLGSSSGDDGRFDKMPAMENIVTQKNAIPDLEVFIMNDTVVFLKSPVALSWVELSWGCVGRYDVFKLLLLTFDSWCTISRRCGGGCVVSFPTKRLHYPVCTSECPWSVKRAISSHQFCVCHNNCARVTFNCTHESHFCARVTFR